jgi:hypothetical protein
MAWKATAELSNLIKHYANFPATGVSLRQMYAPSVQEVLFAAPTFGRVQFGSNPSTGESRYPLELIIEDCG